ncbi:MAG: DUF6049 family protein [Acidimicrobiales bacterium]
MPALRHPLTTSTTCPCPRRRPCAPRARAILACLAVFGAVSLQLLVAPAFVATAAGATSTLPSTISLVHQTAWVRNTKGMTLSVAVASHVSRSNLGVQVTLYSQATERSYFEEILAGNTAGFTPIDPPSLLPLDTKGLLAANGHATIDLPVSAPGVPGLPQSKPSNGALLNFPCTNQCAGVYPLQVSLEDLQSATTLDSFMTFLILAPARASSPLRFSLILPIGSSPATTPSGRPAVSPADEAEVEQLKTLLLKNPAASVSLALYPQFTDALAAEAATRPRRGRPPDPAVLAARKALAATRQLVALGNVETESETFTPVDAAGMAGAHLGAEMAIQLRRGRSALAALGVHPEARRYVASAPLGTRALKLLESNHVDRLVVPSDSVTPVPQSWVYPVWAPFIVKGTSVVADASDYYLEQRLASNSDPVLRANQLLADLAVLYFVEQPQANRGVSLLAPLGWHPSTRFLSTVLSGLSGSPIVQTDTLSQFFAQVPPGSAEEPLLVRGLEAPAIPREANPPAAKVRTASNELSVLAGLLANEPGRIEQLQDLLLLSETANLTASRRAAYLAAPGAQLATEAARVALPRDRTITITSLSARIPISIYSDALTALRVDLVLSSSDLGFPRHVFPIVLAPRNNTKTIPVSARTAGDFQLKLRVTTRGGTFVLASGGLLIRSTAISGVAVGLTAGAGTFLVIWWARSALRRRRGGRHLRTGGRSARPAAPSASST